MFNLASSRRPCGGEQFIETCMRVVADPEEDVREVLEGIYRASLTGRDERVEPRDVPTRAKIATHSIIHDGSGQVGTRD
jgi:hypothetical protein